MIYIRHWLISSLFLLLLFTKQLYAEQIITEHTQLNGNWIINEELSDNTDNQVEKAILAGGGRLPKNNKKGKNKYKGGPKEQAIYDHISYDETMSFHYEAPKFHLTYEDGFKRTFYSDNRKRTISASGTFSGDNLDFSFATWDKNQLLVESRPRDGGWIIESYQLETTENQLKVTLQLKPSSFPVPIHIIRVYDQLEKHE